MSSILLFFGNRALCVRQENLHLHIEIEFSRKKEFSRTKYIVFLNSLIIWKVYEDSLHAYGILAMPYVGKVLKTLTTWFFSCPFWEYISHVLFDKCNQPLVHRNWEEPLGELQREGSFKYDLKINACCNSLCNLGRKELQNFSLAS